MPVVSSAKLPYCFAHRRVGLRHGRSLLVLIFILSKQLEIISESNFSISFVRSFGYGATRAVLLFKDLLRRPI